jgi:hypothetical protein
MSSGVYMSFAVQSAIPSAWLISHPVFGHLAVRSTASYSAWLRGSRTQPMPQVTGEFVAPGGSVQIDNYAVASTCGPG